MKRCIFINVTVSFLFLIGAFINQTIAQTQIVALKNNKYLSIQACSDKIFRVRLSSKAEFPQSLMERYEILKTDWNTVKITVKKEKNTTNVQTDGYQISMNNETGNISVKDSKGKMVLDKLQIYYQDKQPISDNLQQSFLKAFSDIKHGGGIIGDSNFTGNGKNGEKSSDNIEPSVLEIPLAKDERFYGGGATSRKNIQHRGEVLRMWATYQKTEITMPFLMSSNGWAIFNNTTSLNYFDVGRFDKNKLYVFNTNGDMDFYLMLGSSMEESINQYTTITGKPYLLPKWAYGLAFGGNTMENQMNMMDDALKFRDEKIPCDIFWIEPQWMEKNYDYSTGKAWNQSKFPGEPFWEVKTRTQKREHPLLFISKLHNLGFKLALWLCIDHDLSIAEEDRLAKESGKPLSGQEHWFPHLTKFIDQGVDGFKLDPGRTLDEHPDRKYYNGLSDKEMHNMNQVLLPKQMYETFRNHKGIRSFHHYCGGYAGTQHWGASTSGDNGGGKEALFDQLNLGLSGFVNTTVDVMEADMYGVPETKGAIHMGFFLPWVQVNSWYALHHPWYLSPIEKETFRYYAQLRNSLFPYIYSAALQGSQSGMPILRAMPIAFPDDRKVDNMIYQYMYGENLLVGVFSDSIYLPKGNWTNYWTGEKMAGGRTVKCKVPENRGGLLFVRGGAIIPYQKPTQYIGEQPLDTLILKVYPEKQSTYTLWEDDGKTFDYEKGILAKTRFECNETDSKTTITIYPVEGTYSGMFASRTFQMEIEISKKPARVFLNNQSVENWQFDNVGRLKIQINQRQTREQQVLEIIKN
jgi:alpha-glucosidase